MCPPSVWSFPAIYSPVALTKLPPSLHVAACGGYLCTQARWISQATSKLVTLPKTTDVLPSNASPTLAEQPNKPKGERCYSLPRETPHHHNSVRTRTSASHTDLLQLLLDPKLYIGPLICQPTSTMSFPSDKKKSYS